MGRLPTMSKGDTDWLERPDSTNANEKETFTGIVCERCFLGDGICVSLLSRTFCNAICEGIDEYYG